MRRALGAFAVVVVSAICAAPSPLASPAAADAAHPAYFSTQLGQWWRAPIQRIAARADGSVVVAGFTYEAVLPERVTQTDGTAPTFVYVAEIAADGALRRVSYAATRSNSGDHWDSASVRAIALAEGGAVWIAGRGSVAPVGLADLGDPSGPSGTDAWVAKFAADGAVAFATNLGGTDDEQVNDMTLLPDGDVVLVGTTRSHDFPVANAFQPVHGGGRTDGFVARFRGDGSGIAWSSYLGGADDDDASAVVVDAAGEIVVAHHARETNSGGMYETDRDAWLYSADVVRFGADGALIATRPVPHANWGGVYALAADAGGRVLVGGSASFRGSNQAESFLLRLDAAVASVEDVWREAGWPVRRIGFLPTGDLLLGLRRETETFASVVRAGLGSGAQPVALSQYAVVNAVQLNIKDAIVAPDGAVCVIGQGYGIPFGAETHRASAEPMFAAKVPLAGARPPSELRIAKIGEETADVVWNDDGDPAASYEVELAVNSSAFFQTFTPVATAPAGATSAHAEGLRPGDENFLRLVAVFPSGVRAAAGVMARALTKPVPPSDVSAAPGADGFADLSFASRNGDQVDYEIERRRGDEPWVAVQTVEGWQRAADGRFAPMDDVAAFGGASLAYRVRAVTKAERTVWVECAPIRIPDATLLVEQTGGRLRTGANRLRHLTVSARYRSADGSASAQFDPFVHGLQVRVGGAAFPAHITIPVADPGWERRASGRLRWSGSGTEDFAGRGPFRLDLDPFRGTLTVRSRSYAWDFARDATRVMLSLSYAGLSGGEQRVWRPAGGAPPSLDWR